MEANKLMIGDWVFDGDEVARVTSLTCDGIIETTLRLSNIEIVTPIPLTAEILEKNGFKLREGCTSAWDWGKGEFSVHICGTPDCPIGQTLTIYSPGGTVGAAYSSHRTLSDYKFRGVHVFQHALRLCGLKELADNFNVE